MLNFKRPDNVLDCNGKEAVALWYKFIFGDDEALQLLIEYNFYDVLDGRRKFYETRRKFFYNLSKKR